MRDNKYGLKIYYFERSIILCQILLMACQHACKKWKNNTHTQILLLQSLLLFFLDTKEINSSIHNYSISQNNKAVYKGQQNCRVELHVFNVLFIYYSLMFDIWHFITVVITCIFWGRIYIKPYTAEKQHHRMCNGYNGNGNGFNGNSKKKCSIAVMLKSINPKNTVYVLVYWFGW